MPRIKFLNLKPGCTFQAVSIRQHGVIKESMCDKSIEQTSEAMNRSNHIQFEH